jgi:hypothetical protein
MKGAFGLVALLIAVFIMVYLFAMDAEVATQQTKPAIAQAQRFASRDDNGVRVQDSIKLEPVLRGNKAVALRVADIMPGGPMDVYYGLEKDDQIVAVNKMKVRDYDAEIMEAHVFESRMRQYELEVIREGQTIILIGLDKELEQGIVRQPSTTAVPPGPPAITPAPPPTAEKPATSEKEQALKDALESIRRR